MNPITDKRASEMPFGGASARTSSPADAASAELIALADQLTALPSLRPGPEVDSLFGRLVRTVLDTPESEARHVLAHPEIRARLQLFRDLSARGEDGLERAWANHVCASPTPSAALAGFPYLDNYRQITRMEIGVLASVLNRPIGSVAFVGSGPLPLSAVFLADGLNVAVDGVDRDLDAVSLSRRFADETGVARFSAHHGEATEVDLTGYEAVALAAMVGATSADKANVVRRLRDSMDPGAVLLARSTRGLRTLLYPPVDLETLEGFDVRGVLHPANDIINSVVVATRGDGG